jgi:arylsulfatase A-like enzyme/Flp pilus assembly protein TadD
LRTGIDARAAWIAVLATAAACGDAPSTAPAPAGAENVDNVENVLLITVDTLRADALGFAGNREAATPALDRLAAAGRVFTFAHAHCVTTLPSHASILTGLLPFEHGVRHNGGFVLAEDVPTLATRLRDAGFATAAFVGAFPLDSRFGLDHGFDVYDDELVGGEAGGSLFLYAERSGDEVVERATRWWRDHDGERRFLWMHLFDPHAPYEPPEPYATRFAESPYLGEVAAVDAFLASWLDGFLAGREAPTLVVFTADHGEALGEHGELTHGLFAYEATLAVPLVLWGRGVEPGRDGRAARHVDLLPTILAAAGEEVPAGLPGRSLLVPEDPGQDTYFEALSANLDYGWAPLRGVLHGKRKLIELPVPELYDLADDPGEAHDLFGERRDAARELAGRLPGESAWPPAAGEVPAEDAARLRSLGYLAGSAPAKASYGPEDDPKNLVQLDREVARLAALSTAGDVPAAIELARRILAERPSMGLVWVYLSNLLLASGDTAEALRVMREARESGVAGKELLRQLGLTLVGSGRPAEALEVLEPLARDPHDVEARNHHALAVAYLGRDQEAAAILEELAEIDPAAPRTWENLSFVSIRLGRFAEARDAAARAVELDPGLAGAWNNLGLASYALGDCDAAIDAWKRSLALSPGDFDVLLNLGVAQSEAGYAEDARRTLTRFLDGAPSPAYDVQRTRVREVLRRGTSG